MKIELTKKEVKELIVLLAVLNKIAVGDIIKERARTKERLLTKKLCGKEKFTFFHEKDKEKLIKKLK